MTPQSYRSYFELVTTCLFIVPILFAGDVHAQDELVFIVRARGNPYWNTMAAGIAETAARANVRAVVFQGDTEASAEEQLNTCYAAVERKPKFLAIGAVSTSTGVLCLARAQKAGIAVAELDSTVSLEAAEKSGVHLAFSVGSDNRVIGKIAGAFAATLLPVTDVSVAILEGAVGSEPGRQRVEGFKEELLAKAPKAKVVASISADWDRLKAMNVTIDLLQRQPDLSLIYAANDQMALGAVEALRVQGKRGQVKLIGVDGTADAREAVKRGDMDATVAQLPYLLGKRAVELARDVIAGKPVVEREVLDTPVLTKESLLDANSTALTYVR